MGLYQGLSLSQSPMLALKQNIILAHRIELSQLLSFSALTIDEVLKSMERNCEKSEEVLGSLGKTGSDGGVKGLLNEFYSASEKGTAKGFIGISSLEKLKGLVDEKELIIGPDVIFMQRSNKSEKPIMFFSQGLLHYETKLLQIPENCKKTKKLYSGLLKFRNWANEQARQSYVLLASRQREYINTLEPIDKNTYSLTGLGNELGLHETTVGRILNGRHISIENESNTHKLVLPAKKLFCTAQELYRTKSKSCLNRYFIREGEIGQALSDDEISKEIQCPRRTIAKYRLNAGIPSNIDRNKAYKDNPNTRYNIPLE